MVFGVVTIVLLSCSTTCNSAPKISGQDRLPPLSELYVTLDSIVNEGWQLYFSERVSRIASDLVFGKIDMEEIGGSLTWRPVEPHTRFAASNEHPRLNLLPRRDFPAHAPLATELLPLPGLLNENF